MFLEQTFYLTDIPKVFFVGFMELLLSADNAVVIALLVKRLAVSERRKALIIGVSSACFLRLLGLFFIQVLVKYYWIEIVGACFLFFLSLQYFFHERRFERPERKPHLGNFWLIIAMIEIVDIAFALDAILGTFAFIASYEVVGQINPKLWVVYIGGIIGLIGIRYSAEIFAKLMESFPKIEDCAHLMIVWIGLWLLLDGLFKATSMRISDFPYLQPIFWTGIVIFFVVGFLFTKTKKKT